MREGLPNALLEAMACGLACVASRLPGVNDYLVEPDDCDSLTRAIENLAGDSALRKNLGGDARKKILSGSYEIGRVAEQYRKLYFSTASRSGEPEDITNSHVRLHGHNEA